MLALLRIALEANNGATNLHRAYAIEVGRDLFGTWTVTLTYGRTGCTGRRQVEAACGLDDARRMVQRHLRRRATARRRLGQPYAVVAYEKAPGLPGDWLPLG